MASATHHVQRWTWPAIFVGIVLLSLGLSVQRSDAALGWGIAATGTLLIVAGTLLIWVRSRMHDPAHDPAHSSAHSSAHDPKHKAKKAP